MFKNTFLSLYMCTTECLSWGSLQNQTRFGLKWFIWEVVPEKVVAG